MCINRPVSLFTHVLHGHNQIVAQQDGRDVKLDSLEPRDIVLQHFTLERPAEMQAVEIGLYDPSNGQHYLTNQKMDRAELTWK